MISGQAYLFLIFTLNGFIIGLLFDFFRILRKSFKTADWITYIEDILFWVLTGLLVLYSIFIFNNGEIRLFMLLGIFIGITLYMLILSSYIIKINVFIIGKIKNVVKLVCKFLLYPIKIIAKVIRKIFFKPISFLFINIRKLTEKNKNCNKKGGFLKKKENYNI